VRLVVQKEKSQACTASAHLLVQPQPVHAVGRPCQHEGLGFISAPLQQAGALWAAAGEGGLLRGHRKHRLGCEQ